MTDRHRRPRRSALAALLLGATLAVAGCAGGSGGSVGSGADGSTSSGAPDGGQPTTSTGTAGGGQSGTAVPDAKIVATATLPVTAQSGGTVTVGLVRLAVEGQLATLDVVFTPHLTGATPDDTVSLYTIFGNESPDVALVDTAGLKRYTVVRDSDLHDLQSDSVDTKTRNNQGVGASYTFAAPPASVTAIDVYLDDHKIFENVAVQR